tara:strand:- start:18 stop:359 length:342 start_codon:yes stop_codon:yes gene_type:complete
MTVIYDSKCNFCNKIANFLKKKDYSHKINWISRESNECSTLFKKHSIDKEEDSIITIDNNTSYIKSEAVFLILKKLNIKYFLFFNIFPRKLKDFIYDIISKNRYFFGSCSTKN